MAEEVKSFGDLKSTLIKAKPATPEGQAPSRVLRTATPRAAPMPPAAARNAVARVWIKPGRGQIIVNGKDEKVYFARPVLRMILRQPLIATNRDGQFDVIVTVKGGGLSGQAGAVRHGISRALVAYEPALRAALKPGGFLTRDPRAVERKKYGHPKARRSFQFSKR